MCSKLTEWGATYQYKTDAFRVSTMHGWIVYLNPSHLEEVMKLPTDVMSFELVLDDVRQRRGYRVILTWVDGRWSAWNTLLDHKFLTIITI